MFPLQVRTNARSVRRLWQSPASCRSVGRHRRRAFYPEARARPEQDGGVRMDLTTRAAERLPVHLSGLEADISRRHRIRYAAFLRAELEDLPGWHPLAHEYRVQLDRLDRRRLPPRAVPSNDE